MTWVRTTPEMPPHRCQLPRFIDLPDGRRGDLWRCDDCEKLWRVVMKGPGRRDASRPVWAWRPATLWQRWRNPVTVPDPLSIAIEEMMRHDTDQGERET